jgi:predicted RNA-binding Zn-ribbon protein involved in translation (DUF1610 family)
MAIKSVTTATKIIIPVPETESGMATILLWVVGGLLSITVIGSIIGIPLVIAGFWQRYRKKTVWQGNCPYCNQLLNVDEHLVGSNCPACARRFIVRNNQFESVL